MDKSVVSSLITGLRPKVKQAIVQTVHKYSRQIKLIANRHGSEQSRSKTLQQRLSRFKEEIFIMKKIPVDMVVKKALVMDSSEREKVLNNVHESLENRVMMRLATHKVVMRHVKQIHEKYPELKSKLPVLLESFSRKLKKNNVKGSKKQCSIKDSNQEQKTLKSATSPILLKKKKISNERNTSKETKVAIYGKVTHSEDIECVQSESSEKVDRVKVEIPENPDDNVTNSTHEEDQESSHFIGSSSALTNAEVCRLSDILNDEDVASNRIRAKDIAFNLNSKNEEDDFEVFVEEDTFFVTKDNNFLKTKLTKTKFDEGDNTPLEHSPKVITMSSLKTVGKVSDQNKSGLKQKNKIFPHKHVKGKHDQELRQLNKQLHISKNKFPRNNDGEKLHPSWEAKRKQKISISAFEGKSLKFDDEGSTSQDTYEHTKKHQSQLNITPSAIPENKLHPSWEAKRKQPGSINIFQGKKVKFED